MGENTKMRKLSEVIIYISKTRPLPDMRQNTVVALVGWLISATSSTY